MKFTACLLLAGVVSAQYGDHDHDHDYEEQYPEGEYDYDHDYEDAYGRYELDIAHIIDQLNVRTEQRIRDERDRAEVERSRIKKETRDAIDTRVDEFEAEISDIRVAMQEALDNKRALLDEHDAALVDDQETATAEARELVDMLNADHHELVYNILEADQAYDHVTIIHHLTQADKEDAITWEKDAQPRRQYYDMYDVYGSFGPAGYAQPYPYGEWEMY